MLLWLDYFGVMVFAITGCLVAAKRRVDIVGFIWLATVTAIGGGTVRDLILDRPPFWLNDPTYLWLCLGTGVSMFFIAHWVHRRVRYILWGDALGLAVFAVIGTQIAVASGAGMVVSIVLGVLTATFGGVLRDILAGEPTMILRKEIYVTAAALSAAGYYCMTMIGLPDIVAVPAAVAAGFVLRALALMHRLTLPGFRGPLGPTKKI